MLPGSWYSEQEPFTHVIVGPALTRQGEVEAMVRGVSEAKKKKRWWTEAWVPGTVAINMSSIHSRGDPLHTLYLDAIPRSLQYSALACNVAHNLPGFKSVEGLLS